MLCELIIFLHSRLSIPTHCRTCLAKVCKNKVAHNTSLLRNPASQESHFRFRRYVILAGRRPPGLSMAPLLLTPPIHSGAPIRALVTFCARLTAFTLPTGGCPPHRNQFQSRPPSPLAARSQSPRWHLSSLRPAGRDRRLTEAERDRAARDTVASAVATGGGPPLALTAAAVIARWRRWRADGDGTEEAPRRGGGTRRQPSRQPVPAVTCRDAPSRSVTRHAERPNRARPPRPASTPQRTVTSLISPPSDASGKPLCERRSACDNGQ